MNKKEIIKEYKSIAKKLKRTPSKSDCILYGITVNMIKYHFGNMTNLKTMAGFEQQERKIVLQVLGVKGE